MSTHIESLEAIAELVRHRGTQFDPVVVDALVALEHPGALSAAA
jgi:HD-GYP domain-containing protein (c-di-GMP phosphodiesterase class II)